MSRSLSWIDSGSLADALTRAKAPLRSEPQASAVPRFSVAAPAVPAPAPSARPTVVPTPSTMPLATPSFSDDDGIGDRLRALASWVESELGPERWYLADEEGMALHIAGATETQVLVAVMLSRALRPLRPALGRERVESVTLEMSGGRVIHTLWCDTAAGQIAIGLENPKRATRESLRAATDILRRAFDS